MDELRKLIEKYAKLKREADDAEELRKQLNTEAALVEREVMKRRAVLGIGKSVDFEDGPRVAFKSRMQAKVVDKDAYSAWLEANDLTHLATHNVHHSRTKSLCSERMDEGGDLPAGVEVSFHEYLTLQDS